MTGPRRRWCARSSETAAGLGAAGGSWKRAFGRPAARFDALSEDILEPFLRLPRHPITLARFGIRAALPATVLARALGAPRRGRCSAVSRRTRSALRTAPSARRSGCPDRGLPPVRLAGRAGRVAGDRRRARGGGARGRRHDRDRRAGALARRAAGGRRGRLRPRPGRGRRDRRRADIGPRRPRLRRYRHGPGAFKVDLAVEGGVPWTPEPAGEPGRSTRSAPTRRSSPPSARSTAVGCRSGRSSSSASSTWPTRAARRATSTRSGPTRHVPHGYAGDATEARHRPDRALRPGPARADRRQPRSARPAELAAYNANYVGGDIITGANTPIQIAAPAAVRARSLRDRDPGGLHLLGRDPAGRRRPRDVRLQRRPLGAAQPQGRTIVNRDTRSSI